jgi:hypothetical protein
VLLALRNNGFASTNTVISVPATALAIKGVPSFSVLSYRPPVFDVEVYIGELIPVEVESFIRGPPEACSRCY